MTTSTARTERLVRWMKPAPPGLIVGWWRLLFGLALAGFSLQLWPYLDELFTTRGLGLNDKLALFGQPASTVVRVLWAGVVATSLCIAADVFVVPAAALCWVLCMVAWSANTLSRSPEMALVHLSLLLLVICPIAGPRWPWKPESSSSTVAGLPPAARAVAWGAFAVVYGTSGLTKLTYNDASWVDGSALFHVMHESVFRRLWYGDAFAEPSLALRLGTHASLFLEAAAPLLVWFHRGRCLVWVMSVTMHAIALVFLNLFEVSVHLLVFHLLLVDQRMLDDVQQVRAWVKRRLNR
jgi:hypothetical protein